MSRSKSFIEGFSSTTVQKILTKGIGLIVTPIILSYLDKSEYGVWVIIGSVLGYMGLMDFGITGATSAIVAKNNHKEEEKNINIIINNAFALQVIVGLCIILLGFIFSFYFPDIFNMGNYSKEDAWIVFVMAIIGYGISFPSKSLKGLIRARQMISLVVWLEFTLFIVVTSLNLFLLSLGYGLMALPLGTIVVRLLAYPLYIIFAKKAYPSLHFNINLIKIKHVKEIFNISFYWFISMIAAMVIYSTDTVLIGIFLSTAMVTMYALTFRLSEVMREFIYSISFTLMPAIGQIMGQGNIKKAREIYLRSQAVILSLTIMSGYFIYLFNSHFVNFWVGSQYFAGDRLSLIFSGMLFITVNFHASSLILGANLKLKAVTFIRIFEAIMNIVLSIILIQFYGLVGVAFATFVAGCLTSFWMIPYLTMRYLNISFFDWIFKILFKLIGVFILNIVLSYFIQLFWRFGAIGIIVSVILYSIGAIIIIWFIAMDKESKRMIGARVRR